MVSTCVCVSKVGGQYLVCRIGFSVCLKQQAQTQKRTQSGEWKMERRNRMWWMDEWARSPLEKCHSGLEHYDSQNSHNLSVHPRTMTQWQTHTHTHTQTRASTGDRWQVTAAGACIILQGSPWHCPWHHPWQLQPCASHVTLITEEPQVCSIIQMQYTPDHTL